MNNNLKPSLEQWRKEKSVSTEQEPVSNTEIKAAYVNLFGNDANWLDSDGSYFIEGFKAGKNAAPQPIQPTVETAAREPQTNNLTPSVTRMKGGKSLRERLGLTKLTRDEEDGLFIFFLVAYIFWIWMVAFLIAPALSDWMDRLIPGIAPLVAITLLILPPLLAIPLFPSSGDVGEIKYWHTR